MLAIGQVVMAAAEADVTSASPNGMLLVAALGVVAFVVGHATRRFVSEVIVFLGIGLLVGPTVLDVVDAQALASLDPIISLALGAIVFGIGERLEIPRLKALKHHLLPIAVLENLLVFGLCFVGLLSIGQSVSVAYLLAAIAMSTSPTTLIAVVASKRARGGYTELMMATTAVNNLLSALAYGIGLPFVLGRAGGAQVGLIAFAQLIVASALIGGIGAFMLRRFMHTVHTAGERLLFVIVVLLAVVAVSIAVDAPVVVSTLVLGAVTANDRRDTSPVFNAMRTLNAPIFLVFFVVAGADIHLDELITVGLPGIVYALARIGGKVAGPWIGMLLRPSSRRTGWGPWLGAGLMPFAGMAIGLAAFTTERAAEAGLTELGSTISAVVFGAVVVFELIGPVTVGKALDAVGESGRDDLDDVDQSAPHLIHHILVPLSSPEMARRKAPQIVDLAASTNAVITGLHVVPPGQQIDPFVGDPALSVVAQLARARNVQFEPVVKHSANVIDAIVEEARAAAVDLVVLGEPVPTMMDQGGAGRRFVHEVARRMPRGVRVLVVPTVMEEDDLPAGGMPLTAGADASPSAVSDVAATAASAVGVTAVGPDKRR
jgi:Kef-type K+ transport system membrane component KefB